MTPTRVRVLLVWAAVAAVGGWGLVQIIDAAANRQLPVPWTAPVALWVFAIALFMWGALARPRLQRKPDARPMDPLMAARTAALAMAASRTGSLVAGFYLGAAVGLVPAYGTEAGQQRVWASVLSAVGAVGLVVIALWIERMCRLPEDPDAATSLGTSRDLVDDIDDNTWPAQTRRAEARATEPGVT